MNLFSWIKAERPLPVQLPKIDVGKYEARIERNINDSTGVRTEEIHEFFDAEGNRGAARTHYEGFTIATYSYYDIDELLLLDGKYAWPTWFNLIKTS